MSVRREASNVLPVIAGIRDSAVQLVSVLGIEGVQTDSSILRAAATQRTLSVTHRALNVTQRALNVTQRPLSVTQRELSASPSELLASPRELTAPHVFVQGAADGDGWRRLHQVQRGEVLGVRDRRGDGNETQGRNPAQRLLRVLRRRQLQAQAAGAAPLPSSLTLCTIQRWKKLRIVSVLMPRAKP
jgi:hypothetical protein